MQAVILAAGMGKRLKELTKNNTKCMVKVNGVTLIERMLRQIDRHDFTRVIIVVGYEGKKLQDYIATLGTKTPITYIDNPIYDKTNNIYSLALAREYLKEEDTILFESDIIFEDDVLTALLSDPRDTLALVDKYEPWMDGTCVTLNDQDEITGFVPGKKFNFRHTDRYYKTVNIYKFSKAFSQSYYVPFLEAYQAALGQNEYYEQVLRVIAMLDDPQIRAKRLTGQTWYEIDDEQDLDIAESLFAQTEEEKTRRVQKRYGGYWRYPKMLDFCYLVNPYFPPQKLKDELKASFETLLTQYPSGQDVNSLLAAKNFGVHKQNICVGNGAAELIKALMDQLHGKTGFIRPTFEEYPNRYDKDKSVSYTPDNADYTYTAEDIIQFFESKQTDTSQSTETNKNNSNTTTNTAISNLVLANPDNPSGNYIPKAGIEKLIQWTKEQGITFILDESFADFAEEEDNTQINQETLKNNPHLFVMKSISKSYGVPGLRLGVLASGNEEAISKVKKDVAIWNINSFGEFYLQIAEKYKKDYQSALKQIKAERKRFAEELKKLPNLRVIPSQANYIMAETTKDAKALTQTLLSKYNIFIKELTGKTGGKNYLRLAVRNTEDNDRLLAALRNELK